MKRKLLLGTAAVSAWLAIVLSSVSFAGEYATYYNGRFGFSVSYPSVLEMGTAPENDDGRRFYDGQGFVLTVYGSHNIAGLNVKGAAEAAREYFDTVTYEAVRKRWFVLSGFRGDSIVYWKQWVGADFLNSLLMEYPREKKKEYDSMVGKISGSFTPGELGGPGVIP